MKAARQPQVPTTTAVIVPASAAPMPQADRSAQMIVPRSRAGQVSATSIEPMAHSPFSAKRTIAYAATKKPQQGARATSGIIRKNLTKLIASKLRTEERRVGKECVRTCIVGVEGG